MKPEVRTFTRENPCTKKDLWQCFRGPAGYSRVLVSVAHSLIGVNAPRVMERQGYLVKDQTAQGDYFMLTAPGQAWLEKGIRAYVKNHPAERGEVQYLDTVQLARRVTRRR